MFDDSKARSRFTEAHRLLENCVLFGGLSTGDRATIFSRADIRTYNAGETVLSMGSPGNQMMALLSGTIRISVPSSEGRELFLATIHPGEIFGELAVFDENKRSADAIAESACAVAILERDDILMFFERNPAVWPKLVKILAQRLRRTDQAFAEVALLQLPARLANAILRAETANIRFSHQKLANMVGCTRESVTKCLRNWQRNGVVQISQGSIVITNRSVLKTIAQLI
jgi:CRP-like cAMP-binding protein